MQTPTAARRGRLTSLFLAPLPAVALLALTACGGSGAPTLGPLIVSSEPALSGSGQIVFTVSLPVETSGFATTYRTANLGSGAGFATGGSDCAQPGVDYVAVASAELFFNSRTERVTIQVCRNTAFEPDERFELQIPWEGQVIRASGVIVNDAAGGLNDTGATQCLNSAGALVACSATDLAGQDGSTGRDSRALTASATDGRAGFAYTSAAGGCVVDQVTGLTWDRGATTTATQAAANAAVADANTAVRCGFSDWRLPNVNELMSLVDAGAAAAPRIDASFTATPAVAFWTNATYVGDTRAAWVVDFASGAVAFEPVANPLAKAFATRLVRGAASAALACDAADTRFTDHGNGTVTDSRTGLMWQQCSDGNSGTGCATGTPTVHASFAAALARAAAVNADAGGAGRGLGDWRVPNRNELASLVNRNCEAPAVARTVFPGTRASSYWTSTPAGTGRAWYVDFSDGSVGLSGTTGDRLLRLVRAGQ